ncbi:hypothetical protein Dtox_2373 [Desulfofarcimen acetoxidans DSM 771]|uniref:Uncharacterized protein n=1 Tax=Desulfofarcimen acetoxidans (strain ATCC 49208 / DSM 771 / KCTC 5769 / VKM B-1644 / 5575) TaxID=485916 RepID=C8W0C9_DESAS|nr:hypothetical protein [Desulfofarcimen acetoxidans]ACV63184.1 hypothetical protein Dtox_2373 [Desulfofarcimen acetoxidans DSM 771]
MNLTTPKKPDFNEFRKLFMEQLSLISGNNIDDPFLKWQETGKRETRLKLLENFYAKIVELYGLEIEQNASLVDLDGYIESVIVQIHHTCSTMYLVERINDKIRAKMN